MCHKRNRAPKKYKCLSITPANYTLASIIQGNTFPIPSLNIVSGDCYVRLQRTIASNEKQKLELRQAFTHNEYILHHVVFVILLLCVLFICSCLSTVHNIVLVCLVYVYV